MQLTRVGRVLGQLINAVYIGLALVLILTGLYVSLGRELVPWVSQYRAQVAVLASELLKQPVTLEQLNGSWEGISPIFELSHLAIGRDEQAVQIEHLRVYPDVWQSLVQRRLQLRTVEVEGLHLTLAQAADGRWSVKGLAPKTTHQATDWMHLLEQSSRVAQVALINSQVTITPWAAPAFSLRYVDITLGNSGQQRLDARALLPDGQAIELNLAGTLNTQEPRNSSASLYLKLPHSEWATWLPQELLGNWRTQRLALGAELWAHYGEGELREAHARFSGEALQGHWHLAEPVMINDLRLDAHYQRTEGRSSVLLSGLSATINGAQLEPTELALSFDQDEQGLDRIKVAASTLKVAPVEALISGLAPLPSKLFEVLSTLKPQGEVQALTLRFTPKAAFAERLNFRAALKDVQTQAGYGVPFLDKVSGTIQGGLSAGTLALQSQDFSMHLTGLFAEPWHYATAHGVLKWQLDDQAFSLIAPYLQLEGEEGQLAGDFMLRLMRDKRQASYMDLRVGMHKGDARFTERYLPKALSPKVHGWLREAIKGGTIEQGVFQFQGSLGKGVAPVDRSITLFFDVENAELAYQPGWPVLTNARAQVFVEPSGVRVRAPYGQILGSRVSDVAVDIPRAQEPRLSLTGNLQSTVEEAISLLNQAPTAAQEVVAGWQGEGALTGQLDLDLPLGPSTQPAQVQVSFIANGAQLRLRNPALTLSEIGGEFVFDSLKGLSAPQVQAKVLDSKVKAQIRAVGKPGAPATQIQAQGLVGVNALSQWLGVTQTLPASGRIPYQLTLALNGPDSALSVRSSLNGVTLDLPKPFGKDAASVRPTTWHMSLDGRLRTYRLNYDQRLSLVLEAPLEQFAAGRGELRLGSQAAALPTAKGFWLRGALDEVELEQWQALYKTYLADTPSQEGDFFQGAELSIGRFKGLGLDVDALELSFTPAAERWQLNLNSHLVTGGIGLPKNKAEPILVNLTHVRLPAPAKKTAEPDTDPLASLDPSSLPAMDVTIGNLQRGTQALGRIHFKLRPSAEGASFSDLDLDLMGLGLRGAMHWSKARTDFVGQLQGRDLAQVLTNWQYAPSVSSERFTLEADGQWPGSPLYFSLKRFSGSLDARLINGQLNEVQGGANALRIFGLLNFNAIGRRLRLDFSDLLGKGLSYDQFAGVLYAQDGIFHTRAPLRLEGPSTNLELKGSLDMVNDELKAKLLVTLPISNNLPLAGLMIGAPAIGGALFIVDKLLGDQVSRFASVQYDVTGPVSDPQFNFEKPFDRAP